MVTEHSLARPFPIPGSVPLEGAELRRRKLSRIASWVMVGLVHLSIFLCFTLSIGFFGETSRPIIETILLLQPQGNNSTHPDLSNPEISAGEMPTLMSAPITIPKPPPIPEVQEDKGGAVTPGDILGAIGQTLSCGAGNWEHMTQVERARCGYKQPWIARKLPNGSLVMVPSTQLPRLKELPAGGEFRVTGSEQIQRNLDTGPPCPILQNTPCLHPSQGGAGFNILGGPDRDDN